MLEPQPIRSASVVAVSEIETLAIHRKDFLKLMHQHPTLALNLARVLGFVYRHEHGGHRRIRSGEMAGNSVRGSHGGYGRDPAAGRYPVPHPPLRTDGHIAESD